MDYFLPVLESNDQWAQNSMVDFFTLHTLEQNAFSANAIIGKLWNNEYMFRILGFNLFSPERFIKSRLSGNSSINFSHQCVLGGVQLV